MVKIRGRSGGRVLVRAVLAGALWVGGVVSSAAAQDLQKDVEALLTRAKLGNASVGLCLIDVQSGKELAAHNKDDRFIPASNLKLLTSGSALAVLGPDYEFHTRLERFGDRIVIHGTGDPAFADPVLLEQMHTSLDAFVARLVESVTKSGMTRCTEVVVDDRVFDREYVHPDWPRDQLDKDYCAEVSGLNFHANVLQIFAAPAARDGDLGVITTEPAGAPIDIRRRVRTMHGTNSSTAISAVRQGNENIFTISGTVNAPAKEPIQTTLHEPALVFAQLLAERLAAAGIGPGGAGANGDAAPCRLAAETDQFGPVDAVLAVVRTPLSVVLERCNRDSENLYAESLLKLIGHVATGQPGTWSRGTSVVRMQVRDRLGPDAAAVLLLSDGSGLCRANKVTASVLARWLASLAKDSSAGPAFVDSLARASIDGTLKSRFRDKRLTNEVRGKSGYIDGVRTLSGYVTDTGTQHRVAYSILVNEVAGDGAGKAKGFHEDVVVLVDRYLAREGREQPQERKGGGELPGKR